MATPQEETLIAMITPVYACLCALASTHPDREQLRADYNAQAARLSAAFQSVLSAQGVQELRERFDEMGLMIDGPSSAGPN